MTFTEIYAVCIDNDFTEVVDEQLNHPNVFLRKYYLKSKFHESITTGTSYKCYYYQETTYPDGYDKKMVIGNFLYEIILDPNYPWKILTVYEKDFSRHFITTQEIRDRKIDDILMTK
jgi:hypothetical protein